MDFTATLISTLIYTFSTIIIATFLIELQIAWENHIVPASTPVTVASVVTTPVVPVVVDDTFKQSIIPIRRKPTLIKEAFAISASTKSKSKVKVNKLREECDHKGIMWRFAQTNINTNRKRHLTVEEMVQALTA